MHPVLMRQLRKLGVSPGELPTRTQWDALLGRVSQSYADGDDDRYTLERSIELSSNEMQSLYEDLRAQHARVTASEERLRAVFEHTALGKAELDEQGRCVDANEALAALLRVGRQELCGQAFMDLVHPDDRAAASGPFADLLAGRRTHLAIEHRWRSTGAESFWVSVTISRVRPGPGGQTFAVMFAQDITARKRMEIELQHAQKLRSVGRLAAGMAHELNTPIQFIGDNIGFLRQSIATLLDLRASYRAALQTRAQNQDLADAFDRADAEAELSYLQRELPQAALQALEGCDRVASIVGAMKEFANEGPSDHAPADLNSALANTMAVVRDQLQRVAHVSADFGELPPIYCNVAELNQAFLAILINAAQAIGDVVGDSGKKGVIRVQTRHEGNSVVVRISDTGGGIPEELQARIFDPFFTTREVGQGIGQGLTIARAIVADRHRGALRLESRPGEGSTFEVVLPLETMARETIEPPASVQPHAPNSGAPASGLRVQVG
jgi:PAS domain S-box-containing protein